MFFEQLNNAIQRKDHILNNRNAYHYEVIIETKHRIDYGIGRWFRAKYEYRTNKELRFDHDRYNNDLSQATQEINNWQNAINNEIQNMENQLNSIMAQKNDASNSVYYAQNQLSNVNYQLNNASSSVQSLRSSISEHRNQYNELTRRNAEINSQIELQNRSNSSVSSQIQNANAQIISIRQEIASKNQLESQKRSQIELTKQSSRDIDTQIQNLDKDIRDLIIESDDQQRAVLFADCYSKPELQEIARAIEALGFDADYLAYLGVKQNNSKLVRFVIEKDIEKDLDFTSTSIKEIGDKTLLQYAAQENYTDIVNLILSQEDISLIDTLLNAMNQNDISTIAKIFAYENGGFAHMKIFGHTLLHIAIDARQNDIVEKILEVCSDSIKDITDNGDSALKLAIRTKNIGMINIVAKKLDIEAEALSFIQSDNLLWLDEIIKYELLSKENKVNLLPKASASGKFDAIKILLESDSEITFEYQNQVALEEVVEDQAHDSHQEQEALELGANDLNLDLTQSLLGQESTLNINVNPDLV